MIATNSSCLTGDQIRDVVSGRLPAERFSQWIEHLDGCPHCQQRAESLGEPDDSLAAALATPPHIDPHAAEADCLAVLHACARQGESAVQASAPPVVQLGPYRLIRPLGCGGMGAVYLAEHTRLRRQCAVKLLPRSRGFDAAWRERFEREMAAVAALSDPHVVSASDAGEADGWHYLVMEYLDGLDLSRLATRLGPLSAADACELTRQAAVGLAHIHAAGLVHRDIKPSNLMLTREGAVKILDLGLALSGNDPLPADDRLTTVGQLMGTLAYMAPEQLADSTAVDHRADLYALGATLFRLLAGTAPHGSARGLAPLVVAKTGRPAPPITSHRSDLPAPLVALIEKLLQRDPTQRPQSAAAVADALQAFVKDARPDRLVAAALRRGPVADEPAISASLLPAAAASAKPPRGRRWKLMLSAAALPLLLLAGIAVTILTDRGQLVIESDADDLGVQIERGDEVVQQLQLVAGENDVTLRSGTYTVTLDAAADGLQLSHNTVTVTRGDQVVVRVRREPIATDAQRRMAADAGPRYRGETLDHWLNVLENERDVATVIDAMRGVVTLTGDDDSDASRSDRRADAAAALLRAARRYGGMVAGGSGAETPSQWFMGSFLSLYQALLPEPGLQAISHELADGNPASAMAALWVLSNYAGGNAYEGAFPTRFGELQRWSKTDEGREKLKQLAENIDQAVERLGGYGSGKPEESPPSSERYQHAIAVGLAYHLRLQLDDLLGIDLSQDPAIAGRLRASIEQLAELHQRVFETATQQTEAFGTSSPLSLSAIEIEAAAEHFDPATVAWAAVPSLLVSRDVQGARSVTWSSKLLQQLADQAPAATADAIVAALLQRGLTVEGRMGMGMVMGGTGMGGGFGMGGSGLGVVPPIAIQTRGDLRIVGGGLGTGANGAAEPEHLRLLVLAIEHVAESATDPQRAWSALQAQQLRLVDQLKSLNDDEAQTYAALLDAMQSAMKRLQQRAEAR